MISAYRSVFLKDNLLVYKFVESHSDFCVLATVFAFVEGFLDNFEVWGPRYGKD